MAGFRKYHSRGGPEQGKAVGPKDVEALRIVVELREEHLALKLGDDRPGGLAGVGDRYLAAVQSFGDDGGHHVDLRVEDLLEALADGFRLIAHLQGEVAEHAARDRAAALLPGELTGLGRLEQMPQPLKRLGLVAQYPGPVVPLLRPMFVD